MIAKPIKLDGQPINAKNFLFIENGRAVLTPKAKLNSLTGRHAFLVNDFALLPAAAGNFPSDQYRPLREMLDEMAPEVATNLSIGASLLNWDSVTQKCGVCGGGTEFSQTELAKTCTDCKETFYPRIQPVAIVLVRRGNELLLARGLAPRKHHSCLAGFVEVGETVEAGAHREVKEEVGIEIENLKYFSSQSWPFPFNLMLAFIADYKSGEIKIDKKELTDARWFTKQNPPEYLPPKISIARQMIDSVWK